MNKRWNVYLQQKILGALWQNNKTFRQCSIQYIHYKSVSQTFSDAIRLDLTLQSASMITAVWIFSGLKYQNNMFDRENEKIQFEYILMNPSMELIWKKKHYYGYIYLRFASILLEKITVYMQTKFESQEISIWANAMDYLLENDLQILFPSLYYNIKFKRNCFQTCIHIPF